MAFCANCGNDVVGKFCGKCGAAAPAGPPAANPGGGQYAAPPPAAPQNYGPPQGQPQGGPPQGNYAPPQGNYPPQQQAPQQAPQQGGYAPPQGGAPQGGYVPPQGTYAPPPPGYAPPPQGGYAPPQGGYAPPPGGGYPQQAQPSGMTDNMAAALSYVTIIGIVFLFVEPYNTNRVVRFHAFQSIFFAIATVIVWVAATILSIVLTPIPVIGFIFGVLLHFVVALGIFVVWLMLVYKAYNNEQFMLPVIGPMAQKQV